jgi:hypothetical protein
VNANLPELAMLFLSIAALTVPIFSFVTVVVWVQERRKERQAFYLSDMVKKMADSPNTSPTEFLREIERTRSRRLREGMRLGGLISSVATGALFIVAWANSSGGRGYLVTLIPFSACVALYLYAQYLAPRD